MRSSIRTLWQAASRLPGITRGTTSQRVTAGLFLLGVCSVWIATQLPGGRSGHDADLKVEYGPGGVQNILYRGVLLEDVAQYPADAFHIWHMKVTDMQGNVLAGPQYGWGETNLGRSWDASTKTWTYKFAWGSIQVSFVESGNTLDIKVAETNDANSGVILSGATMFPFALHMPRLPARFYQATYPQLAFNTTGPSVTIADYGDGEVAMVAPDAGKPLYSGFWPTGSGFAYSAIISTTTPDGLATFQPHQDRPVGPGETDRFTVSLRFAPSGTASPQLAADAFANWAKAWPPVLHWTDRRPIGTIFLATSPQSNGNSGTYVGNPRRYFDDAKVDVNAPAGLAEFQKRVLEQAQTSVENMGRLGAQGAITWDIEGEQFPQSTSYVCAPDSIATIAPEMETIVRDPRSRYSGMKLDDAYFKVMTDAGFRVGVCIRPQHFALNADRTAKQVGLSNVAVGDEMIRKMKFAHDRWHATLFYVDSSVDSNGAPLDAGIFERVAKVFPDSLIVPEWSTLRYYAYTAPFQSFIFHGDVGTDPAIHAFYPDAFSVNLINDADAIKLAASRPELTKAVTAGDVLMGHVRYWQANDATIRSIYERAHEVAHR